MQFFFFKFQNKEHLSSIAQCIENESTQPFNYTGFAPMDYVRHEDREIKKDQIATLYFTMSDIFMF
jgi:hypothetical protein